MYLWILFQINLHYSANFLIRETHIVLNALVNFLQKRATLEFAENHVEIVGVLVNLNRWVDIYVTLLDLS